MILAHFNGNLIVIVCLTTVVNGCPMSGIVTASATAAGGAPTSALAVESESKHGRREGLCRLLQIFPPIRWPNILFLHPVTYQ